jgi:hypothetical protein
MPMNLLLPAYKGHSFFVRCIKYIENDYCTVLTRYIKARAYLMSMTHISKFAAICTVLFIGLFSGTQVLPLVQSLDLMAAIEPQKRLLSHSTSIELGQIDSSTSPFDVYKSYAPLTYKVPLAKPPHAQRGAVRLLPYRQEQLVICLAPSSNF